MLATCSLSDLVLVLEAIGAPAYALDLTTGTPRFLAANHRYLHLLGLNGDAVAGKRPAEILPEEMAAKLEQAVRRVAEARDAVELDEEAPLPSGTRQWRSLLSPLADPSGAVARVLATASGAVHRPMAEIGLVASEAKFRGMFEHAPIGVVLCAADGAFLDANDTFLDIVARGRDELEGRTLWSFLPADSTAIEGEQIAQLHATGRAGPFETEYLRGDDTRVAVRVNGIGVGGLDGGERLIWAFVEDVTQRRRSEFQLRASEKRTAAILDTMVDALVAVDQNGRVEGFNKAAEAIFGYTAAEVMGRNVGLLMPEPFGETFGEHLQRYLRTGESDLLGTRREVTGRRKDGALFPLEIGISAVTSEMLGGLERRREARHSFVAIARDITERKRVEAELLAASNEAEAASRAKSEFLANMSHELRTPLNAIIGFSEVIKEQMFGPVGNGRYAAYAADIHASGAHLLAVIGDVLDLSRIETGKFDLEESTFDPAEVAAQAFTMVNRAAEVGAIRLDNRLAGETGHALPRLVADKRAIKQVLINLLSNAVKFTPRGGVVMAEAAVEPGGELSLTVADTGPGIAAERLKTIFDPFQNADSTQARQHGGSGLGLAISKKLVELHGGTLSLRSRLGHGTTVQVRLPARRVAAAR
ncbi:MAG: PAS domain S-box protein [Alphaproteobacteria bacterium]|nr:PAS domain S-box protein [Alphaproteobacteria bacterium]